MLFPDVNNWGNYSSQICVQNVKYALITKSGNTGICHSKYSSCKISVVFSTFTMTNVIMQKIKSARLYLVYIAI